MFVTIHKKLRMILTLLLILFPLAAAADAVQNFNIKIGVAEGVSSGKLLGVGLSLKDAKGVVAAAKNGDLVSSAGGGVKVAGKSLALPVQVTAKSGLGWEGTRYRGRMSLIKANGGFTVVNEIDLENYLRGILKIEMNPEWNVEALKAQAILARTYAVKNRGRFKAKGYDLVATENSQMYKGVSAEDPRTDKAVSGTNGQILAYDGAPADIYYHSDSGGSTVDIAHVWGGNRPYLKSLPEKASYQSPHSSWQLSMTGDQIASVLGKMGKPVGTVSSVEVSQKDNAGRAVQLRISGDRGSVDVRAHEFRMAAGSSVVRSTFFTISNGGAAQPGEGGRIASDVRPESLKVPSLEEIAMTKDPLLEMTKAGIFTRDELYDMILDQDKRDVYLEIGMSRMGESAPAKVPVRETPVQPKAAQKLPAMASRPTAFVFNGKGWGHGVGLSQWGAKAMADQGMKCEEILGYYFPGTTIAR